VTPLRRRFNLLCAAWVLGTVWCGSAVAIGPLRHGQAPLPGVGGPLDLIDQDGAPFSLARLSGRPVLLFFGFTRCGSTCPAALGTARQLLGSWGMRAAPAIVFVTLDPLSDGPRELKAHLEHVDPRLIGLTGTPGQITRAAERYGVGMREREGGVDHSSMWYLLDARGQVQRVYAYTTPADELAADTRQLTLP